MDSYQRRPADAARARQPAGRRRDHQRRKCLSSAADPVSGAEALSPLSLLPLPAQQGGVPSNPCRQRRCPTSSASRRRRSCRRRRRSSMKRWRRACSRLDARPATSATRTIGREQPVTAPGARPRRQRRGHLAEPAESPDAVVRRASSGGRQRRCAWPS